MAETLYEKDYVAWLQDQAEKLGSSRFCVSMV